MSTIRELPSTRRKNFHTEFPSAVSRYELDPKDILFVALFTSATSDAAGDAASASQFARLVL